MIKMSVVASFVLGAMLVGCNGSSDTGSSATAGTYSFIDEPVKGLYFESATQTGCTNESGEYQALADEAVSFYLGVCDENNQPTLEDQKVLIGSVSVPTSLTTPYDLTIDVSSSSQSVNAVTIATLLKSFNSTDATGRLDVSGLLFNDNGVDLRNTLTTLIATPDSDTTTVLTLSLFNDFVLANTNTNNNLQKSNFVDSATAESELKSTLSQQGSDIFTPELVVGKTVTRPDGKEYAFGAEADNDYSYFSAFGNGWGIFNSLGAQFSANSGDLYVDGYVIGLLDARANSWLVTVDIHNDDKEKTVERWSVR